jgi:amino acid adenylation domain-containing protein
MSAPDDPVVAPEAAGEVVVFPASYAQARLWFIEELEPGHPTYNIPYGLRLRGALDVAALESAVRLVVGRHETLRTTFELEGSAVVQVVHPEETFAGIARVDLASAPDPAQAVRDAQHAEVNRPINLRDGPIARFTLYRQSPEEHVLLMVAHHTVADGWSIGVLSRELAAGYAAALEGRDADLPPLPIQYGDFAIWEREQLSSDDARAHEAYWQEKLAGPLPILTLPMRAPRREVRGARPAARAAFAVPAPLAQRALALSRAEKATPFMVYLAAFHLLLARHAGQEDVVVGTPIAGRAEAELQGIIGLLLNTLALRVDLGGDPTGRELLARVRQATLDAYEHQALPFERIVELVNPLRGGGVTPVFQAMFSMQNATAEAGEGVAVRFPGLEVVRAGAGVATTKFDLQLTLVPDGEGYRGSIEYDAGLFTAPQMERFAGHFVRLIDGLASEPAARAFALPMLGDAERERVLHEFNATSAPWPETATMHALVAAQAARTPGAVAVVDAAGDLTYEALLARAHDIGARLRARQVAPEERVAVCLSRSSTLVASLLGVLEAGGCYVPLDPAYPADRNAFILADSGARIVITEAAHAAQFEASGVAVLRVDQPAPAAPIAPAPAEVKPEQLAYLIYTSGSTGKPKGVAIEHRNAAAFIAWAQSVFTCEQLQGVLFATSVCFDLSIFELFVTLASGGSVIVADNAIALPTLPARDRVTLVNTVPSAAAALLKQGGFPKSVRTVNLAGEALATEIVDALYALGHVRDVFDLYGPSEDTTYSTFARREARQPATIGRPIANTRAYVLDAAGAPQPIGVPGELWLAGAGVARGYLGRPELTAERFVPEPFALEPRARCYRTGDRVRWREDGNLEYLGRLDHQVKIRGFRVEPGEVEVVVRAHPLVKEAVVVARNDGEAGLQLVAYVVARAEAASAALTPASLRTYLRERLPEYMVPGAIVPLDALPLNANGKVDRAKLPAPSAVAVAPASSVVPARTTLEHQLVTIWEALLTARPIGIRDDFFALGGHSLLALRMLAMLQDVSGRRLPLAALFDGATIEQLAARVEGAVFDEDEPPVVVLQGGGTGTPLAFVHGDVRGGGWYCRRLAPMLGPNPMFVLPTLRADGTNAPLTIEGMAAQHVRELRALQPRGPYRIGGFCAGGLIAYEMACQLRDAGEQVERLLIVESSALNAGLGAVRAWAGNGDSPDALDARGRRLRLARMVRNRALRVGRMSWRERTAWFTRNAGRVLGLRPAPVVEAPPVARAEEFEHRPGTNLLKVQGRAAGAYIPRRFDGALDLLVAVDAGEGAAAADFATALGGERVLPSASLGTRGWGRVAARVRTVGVHATHVGIITEQLPVLAECLRGCLDSDARAR